MLYVCSKCYMFVVLNLHLHLFSCLFIKAQELVNYKDDIMMMIRDAILKRYEIRVCFILLLHCYEIFSRSLHFTFYIQVFHSYVSFYDKNVKKIDSRARSIYDNGLHRDAFKTLHF